MKKRDILAGLIIGELSSWLILIIFNNLRIKFAFLWTLTVVLPVLSVIGLWIADFLGKKFFILWQAAKFVLVGILNTLIDLGVLNFLIWLFGISVGVQYSVFKGISFTIAVINSYFWNRSWTFYSAPAAAGAESIKSPTKATEFLQFFVVSVIGFAINVAVASFVVNAIGPRFGIGDKLWANVGALVATFIALAWNFLSYKFVVFKK